MEWVWHLSSMKIVTWTGSSADDIVLRFLNFASSTLHLLSLKKTQICAERFGTTRRINSAMTLTIFRDLTGHNGLAFDMHVPNVVKTISEKFAAARLGYMAKQHGGNKGCHFQFKKHKKQGNSKSYFSLTWNWFYQTFCISSLLM